MCTGSHRDFGTSSFYLGTLGEFRYKALTLALSRKREREQLDAAARHVLLFPDKA